MKVFRLPGFSFERIQINLHPKRPAMFGVDTAQYGVQVRRVQDA